MKAFIAICAYIILIAGICGYTFKILLEQKEPVRVEHKSTVIDPVQKTEDRDVTNSEEERIEPSLAEKKVMCLRMFGGGDLSAWETAQAECMLQQSESACECMQILVQ